MAASEEKSAATLLDETSREPAEQEEFAGIRVADLGVPEKYPPVVLRHFLKPGRMMRILFLCICEISKQILHKKTFTYY